MSYYKLNAALNLKINSQKLNQIAEKYDLDLIVLFGSWAEGHQNPNSDVDIAVKINEKFRSLNEESQIKLEIKLMEELSKSIDAGSGMGMDLIVLNNCASSLLLFQIASFGKPLYERTESTFAKFQSVACLRYYDDEKFFNAVDEYLKKRYAKPTKPKPNSTNPKKAVKYG